jgi:hypothetical protein
MRLASVYSQPPGACLLKTPMPGGCRVIHKSLRLGDDSSPVPGYKFNDYAARLNGRDEMIGSTGYEIRMRGVLDDKWAAYFLPFMLIAEAGETVLRGAVHDQAELFGVLLKIRDLGLYLISVEPVTQD